MSRTQPQNALPAEAAGRLLPQDLEAEKAVLSALLHDNAAIHAVLNEVKPEDFYHPAHQQLFTSMLALQDANEPVDLLTLANHLNERKLLDSVGGAVYLAELFDYEATAANVGGSDAGGGDATPADDVIDAEYEVKEDN